MKRNKVILYSFGFKYGQPSTNNYFDVSFIKNPARQKKWNLFSEPDEEMARFVKGQTSYKEFMRKVVPLIEVMTSLDGGMRFGFGCNAGRHRSFFVAEGVAEELRTKGYDVDVVHREHQ